MARILIDKSVWIDFFNDVQSAPRASLRKLQETEEEVYISGYIVAETLKGFKNDREFEAARMHLLYLPILDGTTREFFIGAIQLYRTCRKQGITIRKTADCLIAQTAIDYGVALLHNDRDFDRIASVSSLQIYKSLGRGRGRVLPPQTYGTALPKMSTSHPASNPAV